MVSIKKEGSFVSLIEVDSGRLMRINVKHIVYYTESLAAKNCTQIFLSGGYTLEVSVSTIDLKRAL
jgi:hypothetical protein